MGLDTELPRIVKVEQPATGVHLLLYQNKSNPTVAVHGSLLAGTSYEPGDETGIAELSTRLLIRGTPNLGAGKIADLLESVGAALSFRNTQDSIVFQARMTSPWTKRVLGLLADCLTRPSFKPKEIEREREGLLTDIRLRDDDTTRRGMRELQDMIYPAKHPYRKDRFGTAEGVKRIDRASLREYFEGTMRKAPVIVAFAGQFEKDDVKEWTLRTFGESRENVDTDRKTERAPPTKSRVNEITMPHKSQADILIGAEATSRTDLDYEPLNLLNAILGELGFMGRLGQRVRDKEGLAYSASSFINAGLAGGSWTALAGVNPRNVTRALELMQEELEKARSELVRNEELDDAKQNQIGSALMELESTEGIARTSHNLTHFNLGLDYFSKRRQLYRKIEREDLQKMARKYLEPSRLSTVIVGPKAKS